MYVYQSLRLYWFSAQLCKLWLISLILFADWRYSRYIDIEIIKTVVQTFLILVLYAWSLDFLFSTVEFVRYNLILSFTTVSTELYIYIQPCILPAYFCLFPFSLSLFYLFVFVFFLFPSFRLSWLYFFLCLFLFRYDKIYK